ncbi:MAG: AlpA family phage regulatory protein [Porticoccaceae bacterium]
MNYLSDKQLAQRYGVHRTTLWAWVRDNGFPQPVRLSEHCTRWPLASVLDWEAGRATDASKAQRTPSKAGV